MEAGARRCCRWLLAASAGAAASPCCSPPAPAAGAAAVCMQVEHKLSTLAKDVDLSPGGSRGLSQRELQEAREEWQHETGHATGKKPIARAHSAD